MASAPAQPDVVRLSAALPAALGEDADAWLDAALLPVRATALTRLELKLGADTLSATRGESGWSAPQAANALDALEAVRVDRKLAAEAAAGEAWGTITLWEGETRKESVRVHQALADGARVAQDEAGGLPFSSRPAS
ncbi:MAG: hypothetical protein IPK67_19400 [Planctomycetes bacterium]|nr:hypothetical protein [Planctomycetota bacterium]